MEHRMLGDKILGLLLGGRLERVIGCPQNGEFDAFRPLIELRRTLHGQANETPKH